MLSWINFAQNLRMRRIVRAERAALTSRRCIAAASVRVALYSLPRPICAADCRYIAKYRA